MRDKYITLIDKYGNKVINSLKVAHLDACHYQTLAYITEFCYSESNIIRLTDTITHIEVSAAGIEIYYESGGAMFITRKPQDN